MKVRLCAMPRSLELTELTKQTLILCYVTIPSSVLVPPEILRSPKCLAHYSVREITVRRFIPARMRD